MRKVLVPADGSESSMRAVDFLIKLIRGRAVPEVHLLNAQPPVMSGEIYPGVTVEMVKRIHQTAGEKALLPAQTLLDAAGIKYTARVLLGDAADTIASYAKEHGCDRIVMGTRGMGAVRNLVLGSVATKVIQLVDIPVTVRK